MGFVILFYLLSIPNVVTKTIIKDPIESIEGSNAHDRVGDHARAEKPLPDESLGWRPRLSTDPSATRVLLESQYNPQSTMKAPFVAPARQYIELGIAEDKLHYLVPLSVGSPPRRIRVVLDTGSSMLMLFNSSYCQKKQYGHPCFNSYSSDTFSPETIVAIHVNDRFTFHYSGVLANGKPFYKDDKKNKFLYASELEWKLGDNLQSAVHIVDSRASHPGLISAPWVFSENGTESGLLTRNGERSGIVSLKIDGEYVIDRSVYLTNDRVSIKTGVLGTTTPGWLSKRQSVLLSTKFESQGNFWHRFPGVDGIIGLAFSSIALEYQGDAVLDLLSEGGLSSEGVSTEEEGDSRQNSLRPTFALDFNRPGESSRLWVGGDRKSVV